MSRRDLCHSSYQLGQGFKAQTGLYRDTLLRQKAKIADRLAVGVNNADNNPLRASLQALGLGIEIMKMESVIGNRTDDNGVVAPDYPGGSDQAS